MSLFSKDLIEKEIPVYDDVFVSQSKWASKITFMGITFMGLFDKGYLPQNCVYLDSTGNIIMEPSTGKVWYLKN